MLRSALEHFDHTLEAYDGEIGSVQDLCFDEPLWTVRYLVARPTDWHENRPALLSVLALRSVPEGDRRIAAGLKLDQLKSGPAIGTAREITRKDEILLHDHHGWPYYWQSKGHSGQGTHTTTEPKQEGVVNPQEYGPEGQYLRSIKEMIGCRIQATEGAIGNVADLMVDGGSWRIRYLVVDIASSWFSKKILVSPDWVIGVDWMDRKVVVELSTDEVKNSPEPHEGDPIEHERLNALWALPTYFS